MASFLEDICELSGREDEYFKESHRKTVLEKLCDRSTSLELWEDAARLFVNFDKYSVRFRGRPCRG